MCIAIGTLLPLIAEQVMPTDLAPGERDLWALLGLQVVMICLAFGTAAFLPHAVSETLGCQRGPISGRLGWGALALAAVGLLLVSRGLSDWLVEFQVRDQGTLAEIDTLLRGARERSVVLAVVAVGIGPGIAEELLFRGLVQRSLARHLPAGVAIGLAAAAFGAVHFDPLHSPVALVLGLYLGTVGWLAGNVWAPMACHVLNNTLAASPLLGNIPPEAGAGAVPAWALVTSGGIVLWGASRWAAHRQAGVQSAERTADP